MSVPQSVETPFPGGAGSGAAFYECRNVALRFAEGTSRERTILQDVNLSIRPGEFVSVLGGSGVGKTTLLRVLGGLHAPAKGSDVRFRGAPVDAPPADIVTVFQDYSKSLLPWRTAGPGGRHRHRVQPDPPSIRRAVLTTFTVRGGTRRDLSISPATELVVAGYTGRDLAAVKHHIDELAAIGVAPPPAVPMVYRYPLSLLTTATDLQVPSQETSGEVEPVLIRQAGAWYLGVGSDHTDRGLERESVERSKAVCPKPVASQLIALEGDPAAGALDEAWDGIVISSWADGEPYQSAELTSMRLPSDLLPTVLAALPDGADLVVFCGTVPLRTGAFAYAADWTVELRTGATTIRSDYRISFT